jgi:sporulation protein YlmC with PRC-barrel domain
MFMKRFLFQLSLIGLATAFGACASQAAQDDAPPAARSDLSTQSSPSAGSGTNVLSSPKAAAGSVETASTNAVSSATSPILASHLIGSKVKSSTGENVGQIDDVLIDQNGQIRLAVLGVGGFLGIGEKKTPVPWQALTAGANQDFSLKVDRQKLKNAPTIDKNQTAAEWATPNFITEVYAHYGLQQPDAIGGTGTGALGTETGHDLKNGARDLKDEVKEKGKDVENELKRGSDKVQDSFNTK